MRHPPANIGQPSAARLDAMRPIWHLPRRAHGFNVMAPIAIRKSLALSTTR
jgi:hypothetical protein